MNEETKARTTEQVARLLTIDPEEIKSITLYNNSDVIGIITTYGRAYIGRVTKAGNVKRNSICTS